MKKLFTKGRIALLVIFSVLIIDQIIKIWIKTHMYWHESIRVTDWFYIYFTENNGMAFGMEIFGKLFLTTFRIVAVALIGWYLYKIIKRGFKTGYIVCVALILTGALGNIIDSVFYGVFFNESTHSQIASFMPYHYVRFHPSVSRALLYLTSCPSSFLPHFYPILLILRQLSNYFLIPNGSYGIKFNTCRIFIQ